MATGSTSATEFASDRIQFYEKNQWGDWAYVVPRDCNLNLQDLYFPTLPTASSLGIGIVVEDTIILCDGYTSSGARECYEFIEGQGFQARPPLDIPYGGHSLYLHREHSQNAWWLAPNTKGGTTNILEAYFQSNTTSLESGAWEFEQPLPEPLNVVCLIKFTPGYWHPGSPEIVFLSGVPTRSSSTGNKNWIKKISPSGPAYDSNWILLPQSNEKRLGGSCGVLHQNSTAAGTDNSTVVVMAGGLRSSTSEFLRLSENLLDTSTTWNSDNSEEVRETERTRLNSDIATLDFGTWQTGPDVGEAR